jgi:NAD(P)-dependent dehydrogenase (short-subunit alcohol dehydrogenase family)
VSDWLPESAVITGGASGIGLAVGKELVVRGTRVLLADLPGDELDKAAGEIGAEAIACDVSDKSQVEALADHAFSVFGHVDLLMNNAGQSGVHGKQWEADTDAARAHFDVNFWGVWNGCSAFGARMSAQGSRAAIYNTGSENSFFCAVPQTAAYIAAKHAVLGLTESMAEDFGPEVAVGLIVPGWVFTGLGNPKMMKNGMPVDEYAEIIVPQILRRQRFVVSHMSNLARIEERMGALKAAYLEHAFDDREEPDYDVRNFLARLHAGAKPAAK